MAQKADRYRLYQRAVQDPRGEVNFLRDLFVELRGKQPRHLREDFCGTALVAAEWVKLSPRFTAEGYDLDPEPLAWGRTHHLARLGAQAKRVELIQKDVREPSQQQPQVRCAQNFSYSVFKSRPELLGYFKEVCRDLSSDGVFVMDLWGGSGATDPTREARDIGGGATYVWEQETFVPVTSEITCHIHFRFSDGSRLKRAFSYEWRYWSLPELRDLLLEAGFQRLDTYFEQYNDDGEGNGIYEKDDAGPTKAQYLAYLVAIK